jgi:phosphoglucosamine mutase
MTKKLFGTDGVRGTANTWPMTAELALGSAPAAGATSGATPHGAPRRDRQGHAPVGLHVREAR